LLVGQPFQIDQPDDLIFIHGQNDLFL
jgi:hypothetical protein